MSNKTKVTTEEEVIVMEAPIEEVVTETELAGEPKVLGRFKKGTLVKIGVGVAVLAGGVYILSKVKDYDTTTVTEIIESVEE